MTALVTGPTGIIGANLIRVLVRKGEKIRVLIRNNDRYNYAVKDIAFEEAFGDVTDLNSIRRALKGCDEIYHTQEVNLFGYHPPEEYFRINEEGTRNVCIAAMEKRVRRIVYTSSAFTVGAGTMENPATEATRFNLDHLRDPYIDSKRAAEEAVKEFSKKGLEVVVVNPGLVIGPWDVKPTFAHVILSEEGGLASFCPRGAISVIDAEDAAEGHLLAMRAGRPGDRYILGNKDLTYSMLMDLFASIANVRKNIVVVPKEVALSFALATDLLARIRRRSLARFPSVSTVKRTYTDLYVSPEKATIELGLPRSSIKATGLRTIQWFQEHVTYRADKRYQADKAHAHSGKK